MRYLPHTNDEIQQMLSVIGSSDVEALFTSIPSSLRCNPELSLPEGISEQELFQHLQHLASANRTLSSRPSFLGAGVYRHYIPAAVSELSQRSEFVTPYTPYQPEISQGTLQAIFEYQSLICRLFEMDVSNASHYSGATALADAALMARRIGRKRHKLLVPDSVHPEYRSVLQTIFSHDDGLTPIPSREGTIDRDACCKAIDAETAAIIVQFPNFFGIVEPLQDLADLAHEAGALLIAVTPEPIALGLLTPPGQWGADIAVGEGISLGLAPSFGGPTLGIFTTRERFVRQMPGRVCGKTVDAEGKPGYVLTLSTREQHIRREKATSNICSNQALCATTAAIFLSLLGKEGMRELARINALLTERARRTFADIPGVEIPFRGRSFNELVISTPLPAREILPKLYAHGIAGGVDLGRWYPQMRKELLVCVTEMHSEEEINRYAEALASIIA